MFWMTCPSWIISGKQLALRHVLGPNRHPCGEPTSIKNLTLGFIVGIYLSTLCLSKKWWLEKELAFLKANHTQRRNHSLSSPWCFLFVLRLDVSKFYFDPSCLISFTYWPFKFDLMFHLALHVWFSFLFAPLWNWKFWNIIDQTEKWIMLHGLLWKFWNIRANVEKKKNQTSKAKIKIFKCK